MSSTSVLTRTRARLAAERAGDGSRLRSVVTVADSGVSSASNFVVSAAVAARLDADALGRFALAFMIYGLGYGVWRAFSCEPALVRGASDDDGGAVVAGSALVGLTIGLLGVGVSSLITDGGIAIPLFWLALGLPVHAAHDGVRFVAIGRGRPGVAFGLDLAWLAGMVPVVLLADTVVELLIGWVLLGLASLIAGFGILDGLRGARRGARWVWLVRRDGLAFVSEFLVAAASLQAVVLGVGTFAGYEQMGAYRVASIVVGPVQVVIIGLGTVAMVSGRRVRAGGGDLANHIDRLAALAYGAGLGMALVAGIAPSAPMRQLLGTTWDQARWASVFLAVAVGAIGVITVASSSCRIVDRTPLGVRLRAEAMLGIAVAGVAGAALGGAAGAAAAMALIGTAAAGRSLVQARGAAVDAAEAAAPLAHDRPVPADRNPSRPNSEVS